MINKPMEKIPFILYPINWVIGITVIIILYFCDPGEKGSTVWAFSYILGLATALLNFGIMIRAGRRFEQLAKKGIKPNVWASFGIRTLVFAGVFLTIFQDTQSVDPRFNLIVAFCGYMQVRLVLIVYTIIKREKVKPSDTDATSIIER